MIRRLKRYVRIIKRWIRLQRTGLFAKSSVITLVTRPLWQRDNSKAWLGVPLVAAVMTGTMNQIEVADVLQSWDVSKPASAIPGYTTQVLTDRTYFLPVKKLTGISQYYRAGHPGLDFRAPIKTEVLAMDDGIVTSVVEQSMGYGRHVHITGDDGVVSLYAHLGLIMVEIGEVVRAGEVVGEVGMTGWTTGPHLHFEVSKDHVKQNPMSYLSRAIRELATTN